MSNFNLGVRVSLLDPLIIIDFEIDGVARRSRESILRQVIDTSDRLVRERLIELGWTPPDPAKTPQHWLDPIIKQQEAEHRAQAEGFKRLMGEAASIQDIVEREGIDK